MRCLFIFAFVATLLACGNNAPRTVIVSQQWEDITIHVETRPEPVLKGMNEFIVIVNDRLKGIRPAHDYLISLRTSAHFPWRQAIQDGHSGVYRRGIPLEKVSGAVLYMHIKKENGETLLQFPLDPKVLNVR